MQTSDTPKAIREFREGAREQGLAIPIDPTCLGSRSQGLMLRGPKIGPSVILSADRLGTADYGVSGLPGRRFAVIDCASWGLRT